MFTRILLVAIEFLIWKESFSFFWKKLRTFEVLGIDFIIVVRNGNIVWKHRLHFLGWPYGLYIKNQKVTALSVEFLSDSDFEAVLPTFCGFK